MQIKNNNNNSRNIPNNNNYYSRNIPILFKYSRPMQIKNNNKRITATSKKTSDFPSNIFRMINQSSIYAFLRKLI